MNRSIAAAAFAALAFASPAGALTLVEVEDFSDDIRAPDPFPLEAGENFLVGTLPSFDADFLEYVLPPGENVTSQWLIDVDFPSAGDVLIDALSCNFVDTVGSGCRGSGVLPETPLPRRINTIRDGLFFSASDALGICSGDGCGYTVRVFVGPGDDFDPTRPSGEVPLPASATLFALGLAAMLRGARRT